MHIKYDKYCFHIALYVLLYSQTGVTFYVKHTEKVKTMENKMTSGNGKSPKKLALLGRASTYLRLLWNPPIFIKLKIFDRCVEV